MSREPKWKSISLETPSLLEPSPVRVKLFLPRTLKKLDYFLSLSLILLDHCMFTFTCFFLRFTLSLHTMLFPQPGPSLHQRLQNHDHGLCSTFGHHQTMKHQVHWVTHLIREFKNVFLPVLRNLHLHCTLVAHSSWPRLAPRWNIKFCSPNPWPEYSILPLRVHLENNMADSSFLWDVHGIDHS